MYLSIRLPEEDTVQLTAYKNLRKNVYNMVFLAECLQEIGMTNIRTVHQAYRCHFSDPVSRLNCQVGIDDALIYERDEMISAYFDLDTRIRPLIKAVLYLLNAKRLSKV